MPAINWIFFREQLDVPRLRQCVRFVHIAFNKNGFFDAGVFCGGKVIVQQKIAIQQGNARAP